MQFGMSLLLWTPTVRAEHHALLPMLAELGYDSVEIPVNDDATRYDDLARAVRDAGLVPVAVGFATPDANPASADPAVRRRARDRLLRQTERAATLGATFLGGPIHSGYAEFHGRGPTDAELGFSAETLHAAAGHAAAAGVTLGVEFLNRFECYLVTTAAETDALVRRAAHPNLRTVYDTHHAHFEEESQASAIRACAGTLGHVQLSENHRGVPGRGQVDWPDVFRTLREVGYDGHCVIESFSRIDPAFAGALHIWRDVAPSAEAVCRDGLAFVRAGWQAADRQGPLID